MPVGDTDALGRALDECGDGWPVRSSTSCRRGPVSAADPSFVGLLRRETAGRGIVLIVDEVITFRLARGGLQQLYGVRPDLVTFGKVIGGGFPVGAFGGRAEVMAVFDPRRERPVQHGGTFTANPVTARTGLAGLQLLDEDAIARINGLGDLLRERLAAAWPRGDRPRLAAPGAQRPRALVAALPRGRPGRPERADGDLDADGRGRDRPRRGDLRRHV